jgi:hypothetical protein
MVNHVYPRSNSAFKLAPPAVLAVTVAHCRPGRYDTMAALDGCLSRSRALQPSSFPSANQDSARTQVTRLYVVINLDSETAILLKDGRTCNLCFHCTVCSVIARAYVCYDQRPPVSAEVQTSALAVCCEQRRQKRCVSCLAGDRPRWGGVVALCVHTERVAPSRRWVTSSINRNHVGVQAWVAHLHESKGRRRKADPHEPRPRL